jgi:hypothetical protein
MTKDLPDDWLKNDNWYLHNIEKPIREVVKNLRNQGINTSCSCGHGMWVQCETYFPDEELTTIFNVLVTMGIRKYKVEIHTTYDDGNYHKFMEIVLPDKNGNFYNRCCDNPDFIQQEVE